MKPCLLAVPAISFIFEWTQVQFMSKLYLKSVHCVYVIGTTILQIDLLEAEKIGSKDGNST